MAKFGRGGHIMPKQKVVLNESVSETEDNLQLKIKSLEKRVQLLEKYVERMNYNLDEKEIVVGTCIGVVNEKIVGWVYNKHNPRETLNITLYYQNKPITTIVAHEILTDIDSPSEAHGHGFRIVLPKNFYDGKARTYRLRVDSLDYEIPIAPTTNVVLGKSYPLEGKFEGVDKDGYLVGWAIDHSEPFNSMEVMIYYNHRMVCKSIADTKREDLSEEFGNNIYHGFKVKLPNQYYDGKIRRYRVLFAPWGNEINSSPLTISL